MKILRAGALSLVLFSLLAPFSDAETQNAEKRGIVSYFSFPDTADGGIQPWKKDPPKLNFGHDKKQYTLNGRTLKRIAGDSIVLHTDDDSFRVRATFMKTVHLSHGIVLDNRNQNLLDNWARSIPLINRIVRESDSVGSLKPVLYDVIKPKDHRDTKIREEIVLLWSTDDKDLRKIGDSRLMAPLFFPADGYITDVQYRGRKRESDSLPQKAILQILYVQNHPPSRWQALGAFVIVSDSSGEYEFHLVPEEGILADVRRRLQEFATLDSSPGGMI